MSQKAVDILNRKLKTTGLNTRASAAAEDFLLFDAKNKFDLIFAHGVLHHFQNSDIVFSKIANLLKDEGILILTEPAMVNKVFYLVRMIYRQFQSDSDWEWPFTRLTVINMEKHLEPIDGFGWGRHSMPLSLIIGLPLIGIIIKRLYYYILSNELAKGWSSDVWLNSTVTAVYRRR